MKQIFMIALLASAGMWYGCSEADIPSDELLSGSLQEASEKVSETATVLEFESLSDFQNAMNNLSSYNTEEEKIQWVNTHYPNFSSIQELYWDAMAEMAQLDASSEEEYMAFKEKYANLYFPNYREDAGFYIPMTNLDAAFLTNKNCEVSIAGEIVNMKDIESYDVLMDLGRAYYASILPTTRATMGSFNLNSTAMNSVGPEYDSDWTVYDGDRKCKLKARRVFKDNSNGMIRGSLSYLHLEFCFRKKTWLGWSNYSSKSTIDFTANIPGVSTPVKANFSNSGTSSHDNELLYPIAITQDSNNWYYTFVETPCVANVGYQGVGKPLVYKWNMAGIQCVTPLTASPVQINPYL